MSLPRPRSVPLLLSEALLCKGALHPIPDCPFTRIDERYPSHEAYGSAVADAAEELVPDRLLLREDADEIVRQAESSSIGR